MPRLLILRHAKSNWDAAYGADHDRPLAGRGRKAARAIGKFMALVDLVPDLAITSSAVRAGSTLKLAMQAGDWKCPVESTPRLYGASTPDVLGLLAEKSDEEAILIVGHEPTWSSVVHTLTGASVRMATATLVVIGFEFRSWSSIRPMAGQLALLIPPRILTDGDLQLG